MRKLTLTLAMLLVLSTGCARAGGGGSGGDDDDDSTEAGDTVVVMETSLGTVEIEVFEDDAPATALNFLLYVDDGFYDGGDDLGATTFHRVVEDFVVQGGGFTAEGGLKETRDPIVNEAIASGLSNTRGTLSMARTDAADSATSQFFVNLVDNLFLDAGGSTEAGYSVFGEVVEGMDVIDTMGEVSVDGSDRPVTDVVITSMQRR
ncbi:MAG: peptidylprolyl isomerase [Deltaproteobacteria bacterium]|nr:peptidylprolyl isomerase [Deltaproteobacteria bacterium]